MFGFNFGKFSRKEDLRALPPNVKEKGLGKKAVSSPEFPTEHHEEELRVKGKDPLRNFIPIDEVPSGEDWKSTGESLDIPEEKEEEPEEIEKALSKQFEKAEDTVRKYEEYSDIPESHPEVKTEFDKTGMRIEKKLQRGISSAKGLPESARKIHTRMKSKPSDRENIKTMTAGKKQKMARGQIKEFLDSPEK